MKERIYKFLDEYVGGGVHCAPRPTGLFGTWSEYYDLRSENGTLILWFMVRSDEVKIFKSDELCGKIEGYFSIDPNESWKYVRDWFGDRYNMKKLSDLFKFIPAYDSRGTFI